MDAPDATSHYARVRVLPHIKKLDDALGHFRVRITCSRGLLESAGPKRSHGSSDRRRR